MNNTRIISCVGGHAVNIIGGATFDPSIRKFKGGEIVATIPYAGFMLSAKAEQHAAAPIIVDGIEVPTQTPQNWVSVDELPSDDDGKTLYLVSAMYVAAAKALGRDTSRLLTMGQTVVDDDGRIRGTVGFNRN